MIHAMTFYDLAVLKEQNKQVPMGCVLKKILFV